MGKRLPRGAAGFWAVRAASAVAQANPLPAPGGRGGVVLELQLPVGSGY